MEPIKVPLQRVVEEVIDPYAHDTWDVGNPVSIRDVSAALVDGRREERRYDDIRNKYRSWEKFEYDHAARIAYLVENPSDEPILLGINNILGENPQILDGCHRLAAAIYRKDSEIAVDYDGYTEGFENWVASIVE